MSEHPPVTEEMVDAAHEVGQVEHVPLYLVVRMLEAAQAVAPPKEKAIEWRGDSEVEEKIDELCWWFVPDVTMGLHARSQMRSRLSELCEVVARAPYITVLPRGSAQCPVCTRGDVHAHTVEDLARLRQMVVYLESKLGVESSPAAPATEEPRQSKDARTPRNGYYSCPRHLGHNTPYRCCQQALWQTYGDKLEASSPSGASGTEEGKLAKLGALALQMANLSPECSEALLVDVLTDILTRGVLAREAHRKIAFGDHKVREG